jgi:hypothetical protein
MFFLLQGVNEFWTVVIVILVALINFLDGYTREDKND